MLDIKWIRSNKEKFTEILKQRRVDISVDYIIRIDKEKRDLIFSIEKIQCEKKIKTQDLQNHLSIGSNESLISKIKEDLKFINLELNKLNCKLSKNNLEQILSSLPNIPDLEVPIGEDNTSNIFIREHGYAKKFEYDVKNHCVIGETLNMLDFVQTVKISGTRFVTLKNDLAKLERALINFMIDVHTKYFGFLELSVPYLVKNSSMYNVGQLPKFIDESFSTNNDLRLIPTSEVSLVNMVADSIIAREKLPIRYVAYSPCFRLEAGNRGKDTKGLIRMHQFSKVELVSISTPNESKLEHEYILNAAEEILKRLQLHYRVMLLSTGDMPFSSKKTYDIEVWLPGENNYREISSCSNCGDFQSRRMKTRYKEFGKNQKYCFVHTLNGSGLAISRTIVAILENYQNYDGSVTIPDVLIDYMGGQKLINVKYD